MGREDGKGFRVAAVLAIMALAFAGAAAVGARGRGEAAVKQTVRQERPTQPQSQATPPARETTPSPTPPTPVTEGQVPPLSEPIDALNPKRGPGAVLDFDEATAPLVPAGGTAIDYVTQYYGSLMQGDYEAASAMVPKEDGAQTVADYLALLAGYEPQGFYVTDVTESPGGQIVTALQFGSDNRSWNTVWEFVDTARGRVLKDVKYALPEGGACH